jgi:transposase
MTETARVIDFQQARARRVARANEPWLSKREIAAHFGVSVRTITRWMACLTGSATSRRTRGFRSVDAKSGWRLGDE